MGYYNRLTADNIVFNNGANDSGSVVITSYTDSTGEFYDLLEGSGTTITGDSGSIGTITNGTWEVLEDTKLNAISIAEEKVYDLDAVRNNTNLNGLSISEEKEYDLEPIRNKSYLMAITITERWLTPDIKINLINQ